MDAVLTEIHDFISSIEIESFIKDSLFNGSEDSKTLFKKIFSKANPLNFTDKAQEASFRNFYEELFEYIAQHYSTEIQRFADLRSRIIDELLDFYKYAYLTKQKNSEAYEDLCSKTKHCITFIRKFLHQINNGFYFDSDEEFEQLDKEVFSLINQLDEEIK